MSTYNILRLHHTAVDWHTKRVIVSRCFYNKTKYEVSPAQRIYYSLFDVDKGKMYLTKIFWSVIVVRHDVNVMELLIYHWDIVSP